MDEENMQELSSELEDPVDEKSLCDELDLQLEQGSVLISSSNCGVVCKPNNIIKNNCSIVLIFSEQNKDNRIILCPGYRFELYIKGEKIEKSTALYSGVNFKYNNESFMVFHI